MLPEWDRFMMAVKLNRGLKESNHDQLYAYLKQHELHANENKMLMERLNQHSHDPLTLLSNVSPYQYPSSSSIPEQPSYIPPVTYQPQFTDNTQLDTGFSPADELLDNLTKQNGRVVVQNVQWRQNKVQGNNARGAATACNGGAQYRAENGVDLDEEQLLFLAGRQTNTFDDKTLFMANFSSGDLVYDEASPSYDSDTLSKDAQCVSSNKPNNTVNASLTAKLARYKELAEMRMIIKYRNVKEETLQKELHYVKMQINFTLNHNKLIKEEVSTLKQDFKQNENKLLEEFLDMKHLNEKVKDKLYKQDQSLQIVHMLCKPKSFYDEVNRVAIGYKNPFYLSKAKQVQPALYNHNEIVKTNHARALVYDTEDTLEIAETTRKQMIEKMKDPECVKKKVKIAPHDYSKENYLATFTPQIQLTPEHIFWSDDLFKMKAKALKEKAKSAKPIIAMMVYPPNTPAKLVPKVLPKNVKYK
ncbi:hypothetical protein Tco_0013163 [Tanacetum coccineum]